MEVKIIIHTVAPAILFFFPSRAFDPLSIVFTSARAVLFSPILPCLASILPCLASILPCLAPPWPSPATAHVVSPAGSFCAVLISAASLAIPPAVISQRGHQQSLTWQ